MAVLRDTILQNIAARLATAPGWTVTRRNPGADLGNSAAKVAWVADNGEQVVSMDSMSFTKDLLVAVLLWVRFEDAPASLGNNADRYLSEAVGQLEAVLFAAPAIAQAEQLLLDSWAPFVPEGATEDNLARAVLRLRVRYRHNIGDPSTYNPVVTT